MSSVHLLSSDASFLSDDETSAMMRMMIATMEKHAQYAFELFDIIHSEMKQRTVTIFYCMFVGVFVV